MAENERPDPKAAAPAAPTKKNPRAAPVPAGTPPAGGVKIEKGPAPAPTRATPPPAGALPNNSHPVASAGLLPTARTPMKTSFADLTILLYGSPKIGKSTFASRFPGALFLPTEPGLNHLEVFQAPADGSGIRSWTQFREILTEVARGGHPFRTLVLDTADNAYKLCSEWICGTYGVKHLDDLPSKKGYALANAEFERVVRKAAQLPYGLVLVSHAQEREFRDKGSGLKHDRTVTTLTGGCHRIVAGLSDMVLFATVVADTSDDGKAISYRRVLMTKPNLAYDAGDRTGTLPREIPLDYDAFASAYAEGLARKQDGTS